MEFKIDDKVIYIGKRGTAPSGVWRSRLGKLAVVENITTHAIIVDVAYIAFEGEGVDVEVPVGELAHSFSPGDAVKYTGEDDSHCIPRIKSGMTGEFARVWPSVITRGEVILPSIHKRDAWIIPLWELDKAKSTSKVVAAAPITAEQSLLNRDGREDCACCGTKLSRPMPWWPTGNHCPRCEP